jgi:hypothetical protein
MDCPDAESWLSTLEYSQYRSKKQANGIACLKDVADVIFFPSAHMCLLEFMRNFVFPKTHSRADGFFNTCEQLENF